VGPQRRKKEKKKNGRRKRKKERKKKEERSERKAEKGEHTKKIAGQRRQAQQFMSNLITISSNTNTH